MTQRQIAHQVTLLPCAEGHAARHMHDQRAPRAGGGHLIECACRCTSKHDDVDGALDEWFRLNHKRRPRAPRVFAVPPMAADVLQFQLRLRGGRRA